MIKSITDTLNVVLRGWCTYFQPGVSSVAFQ